MFKHNNKHIYNLLLPAAAKSLITRCMAVSVRGKSAPGFSMYWTLSSAAHATYESAGFPINSTISKKYIANSECNNWLILAIYVIAAVMQSGSALMAKARQTKTPSEPKNATRIHCNNHASKMQSIITWTIWRVLQRALQNELQAGHTCDYVAMWRVHWPGVPWELM